MNKNKLYSFILFACFIGYGWLLFSFQHEHQIQNQEFTVCLFKKVTTIPCPSCGTTRSVLQLSHGNLLSAILLNPFGILVALIMLVAPFWISYDLVQKKETFYTIYLKTESILRKRKVAFVLIVLVIANWIWNIKKNL
ncbi:MAG: DUF2752 domain-containing protein [Flavobacterium sp.]|nr:DUF2752 domain-containing protein [Flavobacterium sp.]